jgi:hypothetical protein
VAVGLVRAGSVKPVLRSGGAHHRVIELANQCTVIAAPARTSPPQTSVTAFTPPFAAEAHGEGEVLRGVVHERLSPAPLVAVRLQL